MCVRARSARICIISLKRSLDHTLVLLYTQLEIRKSRLVMRVTRITYTTRMLLHSQEYDSNVTKNLTRALRSNTGTEYDDKIVADVTVEDDEEEEESLKD